MQFSTNRRIATLTAVSGALVLAPFGLASTASAAGEIKVNAPATIAAGTTGKVEFSQKTDAKVRIEFDASTKAAADKVYSPDCTSPERNVLDCTPKGGKFDVFIQLTTTSPTGEQVKFSAKSSDGTGSGTFTVAPKPAKLGDLVVDAPAGSEVQWFEYDPSTGKVKDGIPIVLRNDGPDAYATASATIDAQEGVKFDAAPKQCVLVSPTKITCASNGSSAEKGEENKLVIPATISGKRQAFVVNFTGTGAVDRNKYDNENVVMETEFDVKPPTTPTPTPTNSTPGKPTESAKPVPPAASPSVPQSPQPNAGGELAETGGDDGNSTVLLAGGAAVLVAAGAGSVLYARKRRNGNAAV